MLRVSLAYPKLQKRQGEVRVRRTWPQEAPVERMTVDQQLDLRAAYAKGDLMPCSVG